MAPPRVRTWYFRAGPMPRPWICSPTVAVAKPLELQWQAAVELCWLLPKARAQFFRLRGQVLGLPLELEQGEKGRTGKPSARRPCPLGWPRNPGTVGFHGGLIQRSWAVDTPLPEHFELLAIIGLKQVELPGSSRHPHQRRLCAVIVAGRKERLNP